MCVVSNIGDSWPKTLPNKYPNSFPNPWDGYKASEIIDVKRGEFEALKKEVQELKKLLKAAKEFDEKTGQPHCHMDEKVKFITDLAKILGVDMKGIFE